MAGEGFKALSDPTRRRILELLRERDMTAGELAEQFNMSKPSISHHLTTLKTAGLVTDERHGQNIIYSLNTNGDAGSDRMVHGIHGRDGNVMNWLANDDNPEYHAGSPAPPSCKALPGRTRALWTPLPSGWAAPAR